MTELIAKRAANISLCPCGSGNYLYALYDTRNNFIMYCCHECEKTRRATLELQQKKGD